MGNRQAKAPGAVKYASAGPAIATQLPPAPKDAWQGEADGEWMQKPVRELFGAPVEPLSPDSANTTASSWVEKAKGGGSVRELFSGPIGEPVSPTPVMDRIVGTQPPAPTDLPRRERRPSVASVGSCASQQTEKGAKSAKSGTNARPSLSVETVKLLPPMGKERQRRGSNASMHSQYSVQSAYSVQSCQSAKSCGSRSSSPAGSPRKEDVASPRSPFGENGWDKHASRKARKEASRSPRQSWTKPLDRGSSRRGGSCPPPGDAADASPKPSGSRPRRASVGDASLFLRNGPGLNAEPLSPGSPQCEADRRRSVAGRHASDADTRERPQFVDPKKVAAAATKAPKIAAIAFETIPKGQKARRNSLSGQSAADMRNQFYQAHKAVDEPEPEAAKKKKKGLLSKVFGAKSATNPRA